ncbi:MAG: phosphoribosylaminoimidazolesuccinocarboxamide synthase [Desulfatiglandaceae bacterium]|jgi:phosphoribosylaminoimidazole-succinocarboxamide synthase
MNSEVLKRSDFEGIRLLKRGKVRDVYEVGDDLLIVASDRMSAFDVVLADPIPDKGKVLTSISLFWFQKLNSIVENHVISSDPAEYPEVCRRYTDQLKGRSMLVRKADPLPVECIVRGYLSGSGWQDYLSTGSICGIRLPEGLKESQALPQAIFTPSTKAADGMHDENITYEFALEILGEETAERVRHMSLQIYEFGRDFASEKGIIVADTKFEFGLREGNLILIDEVLTPDSSRFWPVDSYRPGGPQQSFDKQFLRDYLLEINWLKKPPPPKLPLDIIEKTREKYLEALERITGHGLES